jgi:hypothetical protein
MKYEIEDVPVEEVFRLFVARNPDIPSDRLQEACEAATAVFNIVFWCELNEVPIKFEDLLEITRKNTGLRGKKLYIATAEATKAANRAIEEKRLHLLEKL